MVVRMPLAYLHRIMMRRCRPLWVCPTGQDGSHDHLTGCRQRHLERMTDSTCVIIACTADHGCIGSCGFDLQLAAAASVAGLGGAMEDGGDLLDTVELSRCDVHY